MNVTDIINRALEERKTRFAFELLPPLKGDGMGGVFGAIDPLMEVVAKIRWRPMTCRTCQLRCPGWRVASSGSRSSSTGRSE